LESYNLINWFSNATFKP